MFASKAIGAFTLGLTLALWGFCLVYDSWAQVILAHNSKFNRRELNELSEKPPD
jgi:hypothetical protein